MVTGRVPFAGETPFAVLVKHKQEPPQDPQESNPLVSDALTRIILKCLARDRADRYQSAEELLEDLASVEMALPRAEKAAAKRAFPGFRLSKRIRVWSAAGIVLILALALVWSHYFRKDEAGALTDVAGHVTRYFVDRPEPPPPVPESQTAKTPGQRTGTL